MAWCTTLENERGISYFKLLVSEKEFYENVEWYIGWAVNYGSAIRKEKWFKMRDGTIIRFGWLAYSPDSYCYEYNYETGISKLMENLISDLRRYDTPAYIAGNVPNEILNLLPRRLVVKTQLPQRG
jgi:hypothetical protein